MADSLDLSVCDPAIAGSGSDDFIRVAAIARDEETALSALALESTLSLTENDCSILGAESDRPVDDESVAVETGVYVTVHGHFYQPPRENPYLDAVERQPSAAPCHDWNERVHLECYRPNAFARMLNAEGQIAGIVNNFEYLSFNIGPTLMSWLERHDVEVYERILAADRKSCERLDGHGNAIAQVYNHIIMPLANERDKYTQIRWGKADFRSRFGRDPEGMWLAETAVDAETLKALAAEGIRFIILAPSQVERCRPLPTAADPDPEWHAVGGGQIDPTRPYRCYLNDSDAITQNSKLKTQNSKNYIDIFVYDGPISRDMGFGEVLDSAEHFSGRLGLAVRGERSSQLISVATDGETFGHHKYGTDQCLAYAFLTEFPGRGWTVTNYAHYLSLHPPTWEVVLKPVTAWSCSHGVDRWQDDCGCGGGGKWHQKWRRPLREALDWLRDRTIEVYENEGRRLFRDPWQARDEYIEVVRDRAPANIEQFLARHQQHRSEENRCSLSAEERVDALRLLEMQRHALLMYTSCGWFFEEISRPEGVQILRYASRALELAGEIAGVQLEHEFLNRLALAPSNLDRFQNGAEVYRQQVLPAQISLEQVAAHYAISSLFTAYSPNQRLYCYSARQLDYQLQRMGALTLAVGQLQLVSDITQESAHLIFAVLHLGGWDFHCCIQPFAGRRVYSQIKTSLFETLKQASAAHTILAMSQLFHDTPSPAGTKTFSLDNLFAEERHRIVQLLAQETLARLDQLYTQVYRDNYGVLMAFQRDELTVPPELQAAAEIALSQRAIAALRSLEQEVANGASHQPQRSLNHLADLDAIATEASHCRCQLNLPEGQKILERLLVQWLQHLFRADNPDGLPIHIQRLTQLIDLGRRLKLEVACDRAQNLYVAYLQHHIAPHCCQLMQTPSESWAQPSDDAGNNGNGKAKAMAELQWNREQLLQILQFGEKLSVDVSVLLQQLQSIERL